MDAIFSLTPPVFGSNLESHGDFRDVVTTTPSFRVVVCKDSFQWIIQIRSGIRRGGAYWKSVSYHRNRDSLKRRWRGLVGGEESTKKLDALPVYFGRHE